MIYFIQAGEGGPIKIGLARNVAQRMGKIAVDNHATLRLLGVAPGGETEEAALHCRFAVYRVRGEWFAPHDDVVQEAARHPVPPRRRHLGKFHGVLARYLVAQNITLAAFAGRIGRSEATVSRLARGKNRPDWVTMDAIMQATDGCVTPNDWLREPDDVSAA